MIWLVQNYGDDDDDNDDDGEVRHTCIGGMLAVPLQNFVINQIFCLKNGKHLLQNKKEGI